jgi:type I restriction enzyme S subunit
MPAKPNPLIDIRPDHWAIVRDILQKHVPQYEVWAFGSRAKWTAKEYSDLDLAVITDKPLGLSVSAALADDFSESDLPWKVDVVDWATTSESFRKIIERDKVVVQEAKTGRAIAGEWHTLRLGNVCRKIGSGATPRGGSNVYLERGDVALIRSQNVYNDGLHRDGLVYLTKQHAAELANVQLEENDVLLNITGDSVARSCQVAPDVLPARVNQHVAIIRPDPSVLSPRYLRYYLVSPLMQAEMLGLAAVGATRNALTKGMIESFEVPAPVDVDEQRAIAHILGTLDDKIELNRRMNETLEAIARAIFKSWFVDFDPVRAKASGKPPESICRRLGLAPDFLALFPDRLIDSELGEIPEGWEVKPFSETVQIIGGGTPKTSVAEYWGGDIPWFSVVDAPAESDVFVIDTEKKITQAGLDNSSARILPVGTTIISARGTVGKVALVGAPMAMNQSCYGLRGLDGGTFFTYYATRELVSTLQQHSHGAIFDTITRDTFAGVRVVTFQPVATAFEAVVASLMAKIKANCTQKRTLAELRDTLLPKLLSGELRVPVTEVEVEATA